MKRLTILIALSAFCATSAAARALDGAWLTEDRSAIVEISQCGPTICGRVVRALADGPKTDVHNPNTALRSRPIIGMAVLTDFKPDDGLYRGTIYDPKTGKTYRSVIRNESDGTLTVKGCISIFCIGQSWVRLK